MLRMKPCLEIVSLTGRELASLTEGGESIPLTKKAADDVARIVTP